MIWQNVVCLALGALVWDFGILVCRTVLDLQFKKKNPLLHSFIEFAETFPNYRFWQAVNIWSHKAVIAYPHDSDLTPRERLADTWYWTTKDGVK